MRRQYRKIWLFLLCAILTQLVWVAGAALAQVKTYTPGAYPAPRTPDYKLDVTVEELLPIARVLVRKPARFQPLEPGYGIEPGQRVLILVASTFDNRVLEAIRRAIEEAGGQVDVMKTYTPPASKLTGNFGFLEMPEVEPGGKTTTAQPIREYAKALREAARITGNNKPYDLVINGSGGPPPILIGFRWEYIPWDTADKFMFSMAGFPFEVQNTMDKVGYDETLLHARKIHATDPEGTDMSWKWEPNFAGMNREEHPGWEIVLAGHMGTIPQFKSPLEADANGTIAGTINHTGTFPRIALTIQKNQIVKVDGGAEYGQRWQKMLEACRGVQFPGFPSPGCGWFEEAAVGSDPWRARSLDVNSRGSMSWERGRAGVIHWGVGAARNTVALPAVDKWFQQNKTPSAGGHWHVHTYFTTMDFTMDTGKVVRFIDKGHFTMLDHPEVRKVAAKYGNPDEILKEKWIPAVPGINIPGNYLTDYAQDPHTVIAAQQEELLKKMQAASSQPDKERPGTSVQAAIP